MFEAHCDGMPSNNLATNLVESYKGPILLNTIPTLLSGCSLYPILKVFEAIIKDIEGVN